MSAKERIYVIVNPLSGGKKKEALVNILAQSLKDARYVVEVAYTEQAKHATQLAQEAVKRSFDIVAVVGGDGSINEVAQALVGSEVVLAIIPAGSGNGLARHFHIPLDCEKAICVLKTGRIKKIDTVRINDRSYVGVAGIGFDAEVGWAFAQSKKRGFLPYLFLTLFKLPNFSTSEYQLCLDGHKLSQSAFLISFANSSQIGNGAAIAPKAKIDDGVLDVVIVKQFPFYAAIGIAFRLFHNSLHKSPYVEMLRCKTVDVAGPDLKAHIDGEPVFFEEGAHVQIVPASLNVIIPAARKG